MPPKPRFTREEIVAAALDIVSRQGIEALTARELGEALGSSISCSSCAKTAAPSALTMCSVSWVIRRSAASRRSAATMISVRRKRACCSSMSGSTRSESVRCALCGCAGFRRSSWADALHGVSGDDAAGEIRRPVVIGEGGGWTLPGGSCVPPAAERPGRRSEATRSWKISCCFVRSARGHSSSRCAAERRNICISQTLRRRVEPDSAHSASFLRAEGEEERT